MGVDGRGCRSSGRARISSIQRIFPQLLRAGRSCRDRPGGFSIGTSALKTKWSLNLIARDLASTELDAAAHHK